MADVINSVMNQRQSNELATLGIYELFKEDDLNFNIKDSDYFTFAYCEYLEMKNYPPILNNLTLDLQGMSDIKNVCRNINSSFNVSNFNNGNKYSTFNQTPREINGVYNDYQNNSGRRLGVKKYD